MKKTLTIGKNIKRQLIKEQLTQYELARRIHCSNSTIHRYIYGEIVPNFRVLFKIAEALDCTVDELLTEKDETIIEQKDETIELIFKTNVKYYLLKSGMNKKDLAEKLEVSKATISRYIKDGCNRKKIAYKLANVLNCSYEELFEEKKERSKENIAKKVSNNLLKLLNAKGVTVEDLAERTGIKAGTISNYIMTYKFPSARALSLIAKALDCKTEELLK